MNIRNSVPNDHIQSISEIAKSQSSMIQLLTIEIQEKGKEIERLNNIIDELEKWLIQETIDLYDKDNPLLLDASFTKYATERKMAYMYVLDRLKELKGSDIDGNN